MLVNGKALFWGKWGTSDIAGVLQGCSNTTSTAVPTWVYVNEDMASLSGNTLSLKGAGDYKITYMMKKCGYNSYTGSVSGTLYHNSTTHTLSESPLTITAAADDTIRLRFSTSSGGAKAFWALVIEKVVS